MKEIFQVQINRIQFEPIAQCVKMLCSIQWICVQCYIRAERERARNEDLPVCSFQVHLHFFQLKLVNKTRKLKNDYIQTIKEPILTAIFSPQV